MILAALDPTLLGALFTGVATLLGAYAVLQSRRTESRTATKDETQQALNAQTALLDRQEIRIAKLETDLETALARHSQCERRLLVLERQIVGLGGQLPPVPT